MYIARAVAEMSAAKALYYSRFELLARDEIEEIFNKFETFVEEITENIATEHSHQWSSIEFNAYEDAFKHSVFNQDGKL